MSGAAGRPAVAARLRAALTLLANGVSIKELATYLGHSDPGFTLRVYTHLVPSSHQRARLAVDTVFGWSDAGGNAQAA